MLHLILQSLHVSKILATRINFARKIANQFLAWQNGVFYNISYGQDHNAHRIIKYARKIIIKQNLLHYDFINMIFTKKSRVKAVFTW